MDVAEPNNNSSSPPLSIFNTELLLQSTRHMKSGRALGLRAFNHTATSNLTDITDPFPSPGRNPRAIDPLAARRVLEEDFGHEKRTCDMRPQAIDGRFYCSPLNWAEAAAEIPLRLNSCRFASQAIPVAFGDGLDEGVAIAGGVDHEIAAVAEDNGVRWIPVRAFADGTDDPIIFSIGFDIAIGIGDGFLVESNV